MRLYIFAIRDLAADLFMTPYFHPNIGAVVRSFGDEVGRDDPQNMLNRHPEHFVLYQLGEFDDNTGKFDMLNAAVKLALATDYANRETKTPYPVKGPNGAIRPEA